ncbi:hypothetical protein SLG_28520 [Sphingobium sp. SYK-6]|uniref:hypothetical protein n=1 Tax=Sphingobium sp. (strain NBRC 103272 / SYK-6) TaxID=627192 RepID=UPI000227715C|nr:hypothetical protein [Sphingobium sp. SYK-6]BAK67527.1 hypothetical protein SLG_28520 [Sphingobium sp. SYK-6]
MDTFATTAARHIVMNEVILDSIRDSASSCFSNLLARRFFKAAGSRIEFGMTNEKD